MVLSELRQPLWGYITHFMREPGHSKDAWVSAVMHKRAPCNVLPGHLLHCGGWSFLWGKVCLCWLDLPEQPQPVQSDSSPLGPAWTMWSSAPRGASQQRVQLYLWATVTVPALWLCPILTFWQSPHFLFQVLWHLKKLPSFFNISILTSILIKNWMKPAGAHPLGLPVGSGSIKGCSKAVQARKQGWISQQCRYDTVGDQRSPDFWTVQRCQRGPSVMCRQWHQITTLISSLSVGVYWAGHL